MIENKNIYVGNRYVPKIMGEWNRQETYEGLSIVTFEGVSYTSKKGVPIGVDILNDNYWVVTGNYNAQVEQYRQEVKKNTVDLTDYKVEVTAQLAHNVSDISSFKKKLGGVVYLSEYEHLTVKDGNGIITDWSPALQKAFDDAAEKSAVVSFPTGLIMPSTGGTRIKHKTGAYIYGNGATLKMVGLTAQSQKPLLYYLGLDVIGGVNKTFPYNGGTYIYDLKFDSEQFGTGYKHGIAGQLHLYNCQTSRTLDYGVMLSGTNGVSFNSCQLYGRLITVFCARVAEDEHTVNYTVEGFGWNDGIFFDKCLIQPSDNGYGVYYSGSSSEGVISLRDCMVLGALNAKGVFARSFTNFIIDGGWSEFFNGGTVFEAAADGNGYESKLMTVKNFQFTSYGDRKPDFNIDSTSVRTTVKDNDFLGDTKYHQIRYVSGATNESVFTTKASPTNLGGGGGISFNKSLFPTTEPLIMTQGSKEYYLQYNQEYPSGSNQYQMFTFSRIRKATILNGKYSDSDYVLTKFTELPTDSSECTLKTTDKDENAGLYLTSNTLPRDKTKWVAPSNFGRVIAEGNFGRG